MTLAPCARGLTRSYGRGEAEVHALRGVDLDLPRGSFTAVMGPSGRVTPAAGLYLDRSPSTAWSAS